MGSGFSDEPAMVVAATDRNDGSPSYSNGVGQAKWGIAAPGGELPDLGKENAILSTYWGTQGPNEYAYLAGTSQAAPHVAAAVAILLSTGRYTPAQAVQRLLDTAVDIGPPGRDSTFGAGRLDIAAAVRGLTPASSPAPPPTTVAPTTSRPATTAPVAPAPSVVVSQAPAVTLGPIPRHAAVVAGPLRARHDGGATNRALPAVLAAVLILAAATGAVLRRGAT
jgi:subtilisin family serine protease